MAIVATLLGLVLLLVVVAGLVRLPPVDGWLEQPRRLGRGPRRWWIVGLATALPLLIGVAASLATPESHGFVLLLVLGLLVPLPLACVWVWARARSFS